MSRWAQAKAATEIKDWLKEWREVCDGTLGEDPPQEVIDLVESMDQAYLKKDNLKYVELKAQLVNHRFWKGYRPTSEGSPDAGSEKSTAQPSQQEFPISLDATKESSSPWNSRKPGESPRRSKSKS